MEQFDEVHAAAYSLILTWIIDLIGKIPGLSKSWSGLLKQAAAGVLGVLFCLCLKIHVIGEPSVSSMILSGLLLAAGAGVVWSKVNGLLGTATKSYDGGNHDA